MVSGPHFPNAATAEPAAAREGGRPPAFDPTIYKRRNVVESCFNRLKQFRTITTRYDETVLSYRPLVMDFLSP